MESNVIPGQKEGSSFDVSEVRNFEERDLAAEQYSLARQRLSDVSNWGNYAHEAPEAFILTDKTGDETIRPATERDYIKIHLPGPRSVKGDGADWVIIESISEQSDQSLDESVIAMILRPCPDPHLNSSEIAHFYDDRSTNTLLVCRRKTQLISSIHGRNEKVNTQTDWLDILRNLMVALPAKAGLSSPHWKQLAKGLIA